MLLMVLELINRPVGSDIKAYHLLVLKIISVSFNEWKRSFHNLTGLFSI